MQTDITPAQVAQTDAVRLFVQRAQAALPEFTLGSDNAEAVATICRRLDGMPLAIELAAARVKTISPEEIALRLNDRFRLLTGGSRTALPRHQTLRAAIDWSYHLLGGYEGVLFRRLSLFCGSFSLEAAESICQGSDLDSIDIFDSMCRLVDKSLLILEQSEGATRYRMLETIREYAFDRLRESDEVAGVQKRFLDFFWNLGHRAEQELSGPAQAEWFERLDAEHENLRAALTWNLEDSGLTTVQLNLAVVLWRFWLVRGYWEEGLSCLQRVSSAESVRPFAAERSRAFNSCGHFACSLGKYAEASRHYEQSLAIRRELGDERGVAATLNNLGIVYLYQQEYESAEPLFHEALQLFRKLGHEGAAASCLSNLAAVHNGTGAYDVAEQSAREALEIFRGAGDQLGIGAALTELGKIAMSKQEIECARSYFEESLALSRALGERVGIVALLQLLGELTISQNNYESARLFYEESLEIAKDLASVPYMTAAMDALEKCNRGPQPACVEVDA